MHELFPLKIISFSIVVCNAQLNRLSGSVPTQYTIILIEEAY